MNKDFQLGQVFFNKFSFLKPKSVNDLIGILNDLPSPDPQLISALRVFLAQPYCANLFLSDRLFSAKDVASLTSIAKKDLSEEMAARIDLFISGFCNFTLQESSGNIAKTSMKFNAELNIHRSLEEGGKGFTPFSESEEKTVFSDDYLQSPTTSASRANESTKKTTSTTKQKSKVLNYLFILIGLGVLVFAAFNIKAICEPFGLCEQEEDPDEPSTKSGGADKPEQTESGQKPKPRGESKPTIQEPPATTPSNPPVPPQPTQGYKQPPAPAPAPVYIPPARQSQPPTIDAPLREEPLW